MPEQTTLTPHQEDRVLFAPPMGQCRVALIPKFHTNRTNDRIVHGFLPGDTRVEVLFSGRRRALADPLIDRLSQMWHAAQDRGDGHDPAHPDEIRLPVAVYGSWRARFTTEPDGWQTKRFQLVAAIWRLRDNTGRDITRGSAPLLARGHRRARF